MQASAGEYLINHGKCGAIGRFVAGEPLALVRGDRVVVRSQRGLEVGVVLCPANSRHARLLGSILIGELLRPASPEDLAAQERQRPLAQQLFDDSRQLIHELAMPAEVLDVEVLLDGRRVILQHLQASECAWDRLVETLERRHGVDVLLENLTLPGEPEPTENAGCGKPNCGRTEGGAGGCSTCSTGGGCSSCGSGGVDLAAYFGELRTRMEHNQRTPLL